MPPRSRYAVDPSLTAQPTPQSQQYGHYEQPQFAPSQPAAPREGYTAGPSDHAGASANSGEYQPSRGSAPRERSYAVHRPEQPQLQAAAPSHPSLNQPVNHIAPPPHSAGPALSGPRVRIDPSQVPNPVEAQEMDQNLWDEEDFHSCQTRGLIPLAGSDYRGIDQGNSLPRHLRATLNTIPSNSQLLDTTALPLGVVIQPFAQLRYDEAPIPLISNWTSGESAFGGAPAQEGEEMAPPRCEKCRGYVNPFVKWSDGGRKWLCNLCGQANIVPNAYFSHLSPTGTRMDHQDRPELLHGTIDIPVPRAYWSVQPSSSGSIGGADLSKAAESISHTATDLLGNLTGATPAVSRNPSPVPTYKEKQAQAEEDKKLRRPQGIGRVFVIDASSGAVQRGVVREVCEGIRRALYGSKRAGEKPQNGRADANEDVSKKDGEEEEEEEETIGENERVAIVTVAESVGFWNLSPNLSRAGLLVVSDLEDMFVPLRDGFLADPTESRTQIEGLLDSLPAILESKPEGNRCALGAAVKGVVSGLRKQGGQVNLFLTVLPDLGPGKLKPREDVGLYNTDKERSLFSPANPFWVQTAEEAAQYGVGINTFFFPDQYTDVASVGHLSAVTSGESFFHPRFDATRDRYALQEELKRIICASPAASKEIAYDATLRVRCSAGLRVHEYLGNFYQSTMTDVELANVTERTAVGVTMRYDSRLDEKDLAYIQAAMLYTTSAGERRVRVLNLSVHVTSLIGNVFRFADLDAIVTIFAKEAANQTSSKMLRDVRQNLTARSNKLLLMYRRHCAAAVQAGQLILPESTKMLPLYNLCLNKSKALKGGTVTSDVRTLFTRKLRSYGTTALMTLLYPRILAIHDLKDHVGFPAGPQGRLQMPALMRAGYGWMVAEGAYLMTNGETAMLWLGAAVSPQILDDLWGVDALEDIDTRMTQLPKLPTLLSTQIRNILTHFERVYGQSLPITIIRQNMDGMEIEYANALVEDSNNDALSYTDYLMTTHKSISNDMMSGKGESWRPW